MKLLLISIFLSILLSDIPSKDHKEWKIIQDEKIWIGYTETDYPWCKTKSVFNNTIEEILPLIENVNNYYKIFDSLTYSNQDSNKVVHIKVDFPIPFKDRDYIVKFERIFDEKDIIYRFHSIKDSNESSNEKYIRLTNAAGEWRLSPINDNITEVTYIWNGELKGNMFSWTLKKAWLKQGNEIMTNLKDILNNK